MARRPRTEESTAGRGLPTRRMLSSYRLPAHPQRRGQAPSPTLLLPAVRDTTTTWRHTASLLPTRRGHGQAPHPPQGLLSPHVWGTSPVTNSRHDLPVLFSAPQTGSPLTPGDAGQPPRPGHKAAWGGEGLLGSHRMGAGHWAAPGQAGVRRRTRMFVLQMMQMDHRPRCLHLKQNSPLQGPPLEREDQCHPPSCSVREAGSPDQSVSHLL